MIFRNEKYLQWVRQRPCIVSQVDFTQMDACIVAHHVRYLSIDCGMGMKPSDYRVLPLTAKLHQLLHSGSEKEFWHKHGIDVEMEMIEQLKLYMQIYALPKEHIGLLYNWPLLIGSRAIFSLE